MTHSGFNDSSTDPVKFLQIWVVPDRPGHSPGYEQKSFAEEARRNQLRLVASSTGRDGSVSLHQEVDLYSATLEADTSLSFALGPGRHAWLQVIAGDLLLDDVALGADGGAAIAERAELTFRAGSAAGAHFLLFDLA